MNKIEVFKEELDLISNKDVQGFVIFMLSEVPDYFFKVAASSTGKFHPSYALGDGGLIRHTKAAVRIAHELLRLEMYSSFLPYESEIYAALILHDSLKHGTTENKYTVAEHPLIAADFIVNNCAKQDLKIANFVADLIKTHMGQWNCDYKTKKQIMEKPQTKLQKFVHQCDYLASRKCLEFNFDAALSS